MGRSQRRKVLSQGIAADGELWAEGVGFIPPEADAGAQGLEPVNAGPKTDLDPEAQKLPVTYGDTGGPLQGSIVQSAYSDGGTQPTEPDLDGGTEPEPEVPTPVISSIDPTTAVSGDPDITMTVTGTGFTDLSSVVFGVVGLPTTFISETELNAVVSPSQLLPGTQQCSVYTGLKQSNEVVFTITEAVP